MDNAIEIHAEGKVLNIGVTGKLTKEFYEAFRPAVEEIMAKYGKVRILFQMHDFHGWTAGALWEDIKFDFAHWNSIERLAMVGESKWEAGMAAFCKPFTTAKIKYFDKSKLAEAKAWIAADD